LSEIRIRAAEPADAEAVARVHVRAWRESYRGLVPDHVIEALSVERNTQMWDDILSSGELSIVHLVEQLGGGATAQPVGFGSATAARSPALGASGEVTAIYLLDKFKRRGIGRMLLNGLLGALVARGHLSAGLWVLAANHGSRCFYEALGGNTGPERIITDTPGDMHEIAYIWDDLARFCPSSDQKDAAASLI
jgi:GNAT superfamily N-acetyltransferase